MLRGNQMTVWIMYQTNVLREENAAFLYATQIAGIWFRWIEDIKYELFAILYSTNELLRPQKMKELCPKQR